MPGKSLVSIRLWGPARLSLWWVDPGQLLTHSPLLKAGESHRRKMRKSVDQDKGGLLANAKTVTTHEAKIIDSVFPIIRQIPI